MPIYQYRCKKCNHEFKVLQKHSDKVKMLESGPCEECGERDLEEIISRSTFHLKGGGWAENGYD